MVIKTSKEISETVNIPEQVINWNISKLLKRDDIYGITENSAGYDVSYQGLLFMVVNGVFSASETETLIRLYQEDDQRKAAMQNLINEIYDSVKDYASKKLKASIRIPESGKPGIVEKPAATIRSDTSTKKPAIITTEKPVAEKAIDSNKKKSGKDIKDEKRRERNLFLKETGRTSMLDGKEKEWWENNQKIIYTLCGQSFTSYLKTIFNEMEKNGINVHERRDELSKRLGRKVSLAYTTANDELLRRQFDAILNERVIQKKAM